MKAPLRTLREHATKDKDNRAAQTLRDARLSERFDAPIAGLAVVTVLLLAFAGYMVALSIDRSGTFDPPMVHPLPDARILTNLRDSSAPFVGGAVLSDGAGAVVMLRQDGQLSEFDETTGLVATQTLDPKGTELTSDLAGLSAGCGRLQLVEGGIPCPARDRLFVLSKGGGLVESDDRRDWRVRLRDAPWIGRDGDPVTQGDVVAWASSGDGRWIAVFAGEKGLAIFDQRNDLWVVPRNVDRLLEAANEGTVHLLSDRSQFWLGTESGIARLDPNRPPASLIWSQDTGFRVRDMDVTSNDEVLALIEGTCTGNVGSGCLSIVLVRDVEQTDVIVGEVEKISTLSDTTIRHASLQGTKIVVVDEAGLFVYDQSRRTWRTLAAGTVDAFWVDAKSGVVTATIADRLVRVAGGAVIMLRDLEGAPFTQIEVTASGRTIGLGSDGQLRDLLNDAVLASRDGALPDGVVFQAGAAIGDRVILVSRAGLLVHDVAARGFWWQDEAAVADAAKPLLRPAITLREAAGRIWLIDAARGEVATVDVSGTLTNISVAVSDMVQLRGPFRSFNADPGGLFVVDQAGQPFRMIATAAAPLAVTPLGDVRRGQGTLTTAAGHSEGILFATSGKIWDYNLQDREWGTPFDPPAQERIADLSVGDGLLLLSTSEKVFHTGSGGWETLIGGGAVAQMGLSDVTDAMSVGARLWLGGQGVVQLYDLQTSRFGQQFIGGRGAVRIVDYQGGQPVWLSNRQLRKGKNPMTQAPVLGAWRAADGIVALAQGPNHSRFAIHWPTRSTTPTCTFLSADPPKGNVIDAVAVPGDRILAATISGVGLYVDKERRWLTVEGVGPTADLRLYVTGGHLVAVTDTVLRSMPLGDIPVPHSCEAPQITLDWDLTVEGQSVSFDPARSEALVLAGDGSLRRWFGGMLLNILPASNKGPALVDLLQVDRVGNTLVFAGVDGLWRYELDNRRWAKTQIVLPTGAGAITEVDVSVQTPAQAGVTVWTRSGRSYVGTWNMVGNSIQMARTRPPAFAPFRTAPADIRDISGLADGNWVVGAPGGIEVTRPGQQRPSATIVFPVGVSVGPTPVNFGPTHAFVVGPSIAPERLYILPPDAPIETRNGPLTELSYEYRPDRDRAWGLESGGNKLWRISENGAVLSCPVVAGQTAMVNCREVLAPPLSIEGFSISAAFETGDVTYATIDGGLALIDRNFRVRTPVAGPQPLDDAKAINWAGGIIYWEGAGGSLWWLDGAIAQLMATDVKRLTEFESDILAATPAGLVRFELANVIRAVELAQTLPLTAQSFDWVSQRRIVGLDFDGFVASAAGPRLSRLPLPDPNQFAVVWPMTQGRVWAQRTNGDILAMQPGQCETPNYTRGVFANHAPGPTVPCMRVIAGTERDDPGLGGLLAIIGSGAPVLHFEKGALPFDSTNFGDPQPSSARIGSLRLMADERDALTQRIKRGPGGQPELAPAELSQITRQVKNGIGAIIAELSSQPAELSAMSIGWLGWDRETRGFDVAMADSSRRVIPPAQFIRGGRMLLDHPGVARYAGAPSAFDWITPHSVWHFSGPHAAPTLRSLIDLPDPQGLEAGQLLFERGQGLDRNAVVTSGGRDQTVIQIGAMTITAGQRSQTVTAKITQTNSADVRGFAANGFEHDARISAGWGPSGPVIATPIGLVPSSGFGTVLPLPGGRQLQRITVQAGVTYAQERSGIWWRYSATGAKWSETADPFARRKLARLKGVDWSLDTGRLTIATEDPTQQWRVARDGLRFDVDRLIALAATPKAVVIGTGLGTHSRMTGSGLSGLGAPDQPNVPTRAFDALPVRPGVQILFAGGQTGVPIVWDVAGKVWGAPQPNEQPWQYRRAIETEQIQLDLLAGRSAIARRAVTHPGGAQRFARFSWSKGGVMPFDRANALHSENNMIYVGTDLGLRVIDGTPGISDRFVDLAAVAPAGDDPVWAATQVGRPSSDPSRLMARNSAGDCVTIGVRGSSSPCTDPGMLDSLSVESDGLWTWNKTSRGLQGVYHLNGGTTRSIATDPVRRWPHDMLTAHAACGGQTVELWSDGQTLRSSGVILEQNIDGWSEFLCQQAAVPLAPSVQLNAGLFMVSDRRQVPLKRTGSSAWSGTDPSMSAAIVERAAGLWAYEAGRLRIMAEGAAATGYEYRRASGQWHAMPWHSGLPAMDQTDGVLSDDDNVFRMTPIGVVEQKLGKQTLILDPDAVLFRTTDAVGGFETCRPDRVARLDGRAHTYPGATDEPIKMRCQDGRVLTEKPGGALDVGAYAVSPDDPFAMRPTIDEENGWTWTLSDKQAGHDPFVEILFRDNPVSLSAGRFDLDEYRALAAPFEGQVSVVAGLGLWDYPNRQLGVKIAARPTGIPNPEAVTQITGDKDQISGAPLRCLRRGQSAAVIYDRAADPRQVDACFDWRGQDRLFQYRHQTDTGATALGLAANGPLVARKLIRGQFEDRIAIGLPQPIAPNRDLLVPVGLGAVVLDADGQTKALYSHADVVGVTTLPQAGPAILTRTGVFALSEGPIGCASLAGALAQLPDGNTVNMIVTRGMDRLHFQGHGSDGAFLVTVQCDTDGLLSFADRFAVDQRTRHIAQLRTRPQATPVVQLMQSLKGDLILTDGQTRHQPLPNLTGNIMAVFASNQPRGAVILTDKEVYFADVDALILALADGAQTVPLDEYLHDSVASVQTATPDNNDSPSEPVEEVPTLSLAAPVTPVLPPPGAPVTTQPPNPPIATIHGKAVFDLENTTPVMIRAVQLQLLNQGFYVGLVDGLMGPLTSAAIEAFQQSLGDPETGYLTAQQYNTLVLGG